MFGPTGQPGAKPQAPFTFGSGSTTSGATPGGGGFSFGAPSAGPTATTISGEYRKYARFDRLLSLMFDFDQYRDESG